MTQPALPVENVQDYPRPPALEPVPQTVTIRLGGREIARTDAALRVLETHHAPTYYLPPDAFHGARLTPARGSSLCEWKGRAVYWDVVAEQVVAARAAWSYPDPTDRFAALRDHVAVYPGLMEACHVGGIAVTPQPGDFYGGWVTPNLAGIVKGGPGTLGW